MRYLIHLAGKEVYWADGDRAWLHLIGKFDSRAAATRCAEEWSARTGRRIVYS